MEPLTPREQAVLTAIQASLEQQGFPPTVREIAKGLGTGLGVIHEALVGLEVKGRIHRLERKPRAIRVLASEEPV